ncbi:UNVERIFIED_CONTAM: hypothetical protein PYX00_010109 [Menopon gallinae]|uniref:Post-GPI attachment to proteins factor 3 n=1 Tax=Menopon gallinae TaxID=328185 RepID=A0AAW2HDX0_9NEOP
MILSLKWPLLIVPLCKGVFASVGDSSPYYNACVKECSIDICKRGKEETFSYNLFGLIISLWSCLENCEYMCQWKTVEIFQRNNWRIPQFKGKWPFIRLFGLQEPASVVFSLFNFFVILKMFLMFKEKVSKNAPYYYIWHFYTGVCLNCWLWSSVYHTRDNDFTERMDYMSAFLMVMTSFYTMGLRHLSATLNVKTILWTVFCGCIALNHLAYLCFYYFDYEYNMKLNCAVGGLTVVGWILWTFLSYPTQRHSWKASMYSVSVVVSTALELTDFPPIFWVFDAHSLWHLSTAFLNIIFYSFIIDDCNYLTEIKVHISDSKTKLK